MTPHGSFALDLAGRSTELGAGYAALLGYGAVPVREGLDRWFDRCHPSNIEHLRQAIDDCVSGATGSLQLVVGQRANNGAWQTVRLTAVAIAHDDDGRVVRLAGDAADLTGAPPVAAANDDAARVRARLDAVHALQSNSQAILYALERRRGRIAPVMVSSNIERLLGFTETEALLPDWWLEHIHPDDREKALSGFSTVSTQDSVVHEYRFVRQDGVNVWVQDTARVVRRDAQGPVEIVGSWTDITARHEAERELRDRDARLGLAMQAANQVFWDVGLRADTPASVVSPEYARMLGYNPTTFRESLAAWRERTHPDDVERVLTAWTEYLAGRSAAYSVEFRQRTGRGDWAWIQSSGTIVERDAFERPARVLGIHVNITDRKRAELRAERLSRLNAAFARCNAAIIRSGTESDLFPQLCEIVVRYGGVAMAWIGVADEDTATVRPIASYGDGREYLDGLVISTRGDDPLGQGPTGTAIRENRPYWVDDFSANAATTPWHDRGSRFGWAASGCLPLVRAGHVVGVLTMYARESEVFDETGRALLADLAAEIRFALDTFDIDRQLRRSETVLAEAQRIAHIGSWEHDIATGQAYWSDESYAIMGNVPTGTPITFEVFFSAVHPDDRHIIDMMLQQSIKERILVEVEFRVLRADGSTKHVRGRCMAYFNEQGTPVRAAGTLQDVTEQHRSEELLRLQGAALDSSANGVVITDRNATIEWVNPAFTAVSGYSLEEAVGRNTRDLLNSGVHDQSFFRQMWGTILQGQVWTGEMTNRRKDGSLHLEEQTITPVRNASGAISHFVGVKRDLTAQKRLEQQFLQAQKMEVIGRLAGGVAHDFNNLLTIINGTCELALMELPIGHPMRAEFEEIQGAGDRAARLTKQLLAFSRKQMLAPAVVHVGAHVTQSAKMLRRLIGEDITLVLDAPEDAALNVFADPSQLEQVMLNLAVNARDAMPNGGTLTISTTAETLTPEFAALHEVTAGPYVKLSVADTGSGMTPEVRERIFEPFFTTKASGQGTGLGLATVYGVVHQSGGTIEVVSEPGRGACFSVYFPLVLDPADTTPAAQPSHAPGSEMILLVEDETSLRDMTARMLESAGYRVMTARNGEDALELLHDYPAMDLVITDVVMPGMSGPDLAEKLLAARPRLKVLFVSGYTDDKLGAMLAMSGANFLPKPFTVTALTRKVRQILDTPATA